MAKDTMKGDSGATPEHRRLGALVGRWRTRGRVLTGPSGNDVEIEGGDAYEWLPGGHFLLHHVDVSIGGERIHNLEVIGYDPETGRYPTRFFDHEGNSGTYVATVSDGVWTFSTEEARATLVVDPSGRRMEAEWERRDEEGVWHPWMEMAFTRAD